MLKELFKRPAGLVLAYHRIAALDADPQRLAVTPEHFSQHLDILRTCCRTLPSRALFEGARGGRLPNRAVAVTLDDGYADNLVNAKPSLERHDVPATVFLASSYLGSLGEFWWDDLERLLLTPGRLPERLELNVAGSSHVWHLDDSCVYDESASRRHRDWHIEIPDDPTPRHLAYRSLCRLLRSLPAEDRHATVRDLSELAQGVAGPRETHRVLQPDDVACLAEGGLVDIGAHTSTHPQLSAISPDRQRSEIEGSRARLQEITGLDVSEFAYPFGSRADYSPATVDAVRRAGFTAAYSTCPGVVRPTSDPFQLPRVLIRNWDAETFAGRLREWLGDEAVVAIP